MTQLVQDLRMGWRSLWKNPGFAVVALLTMAVGIGANAAIFSYIDGAMLRPLPFPNGPRMVRITEVNPKHEPGKVSAGDFGDFQRQLTSFEAITAQQWNTAPFSHGDAKFELPNEKVSLEFFDVFRIQPQLGRTFVPGEDQPGKNHVAVISHLLWATEFASDPAVIGKTFRLEDDVYTVIGVLPEGTFDHTSTRLWRPLALGNAAEDRGTRNLNCWASLRPGVSLGTAQAETATLMAQIDRQFPDSHKGWTSQIDWLSDILVTSDIRQSLLTLMGAVFLVLVIACANLANLTLARATARAREVAIRSALGASRGRLIRQFLTESVMLSTGGGLLGLGVAYGGMAGLRLVVPPRYLPANVYVALDGRVLAFILLLSVLSGIAFGLYPALQASRTDLTTALQQAGRGASAGRSSRFFRAGLIIAEVSLAFVLLNGAGLLIRSFFNFQHVDTGFTAEDMMTGYLPMEPLHLANGESLSNHVRQIVRRVGAISGVEGVAVSAGLPIHGGGYMMPFILPGHPPTEASQVPLCHFGMVTPSYFSTLGLRLLRGRFLNDHDSATGTPAMVINQTLAKKYFPNADPIGQRLIMPRLAFPGVYQNQAAVWEVVGVVADEKTSALNIINDSSPAVYVPIDQSPQVFQALLVRTQGDPNRYLRQITAALQQVNSEQRLMYPLTLDQIKAEATGDTRLHSLLLSIFAGIAVGLSVIGLYGVVAYSVNQRSREIGIRTALGATRHDVLWLVLQAACKFTAAGLLLGYAGSFLVGRLLQSLLFQIQRYDLTTAGMIAVLLAAMMLLASWIPAQRALRVDPQVALRQE